MQNDYTSNQKLSLLIFTPFAICALLLLVTTASNVGQASRLRAPDAPTYVFNTYLNGGPGFTTPFGIARDGQGRLLVADGGKHEIQVFNSANQYVSSFGSAQLQFPYGVAVDANGNVYVSDYDLNKIFKFDASFNFIKSWGGKGAANSKLDKPAGIAVMGNRVYVIEVANDRVQIFDLDGVFVKKFGAYGTVNGKFFGPYGITVDAQGNVYVADTGNHRIQKFNKKGKWVKTWGGLGKQNGQFNYPRMLALNNAGHLFVADEKNHRVQIFDKNGVFLSKFGKKGTSNGQMKNPVGVVSEPSGMFVYVSEKLTTRVSVWCNTACPTATKTFTWTPASPVITKTFTPTKTWTWTPSYTRTPGTPTHTHTFTRTPTRTDTPTATRTFTFTPTKTSTPTYTRTFTHTPTFTWTPSLTPSHTPTNTPTLTPSCAPLPSGANSWWRAENNANDAIGANDGSEQNGATYGIGKVGQAFSFDGVDDYVLVPDSADQKPSTITVEGWVAFAQLPPIDSMNVAASKYAGYAGWHLGAWNASGALYPSFTVHRQPSFADNGYSPESIALNTWVHIAGTYDGNVIKIFVDGVEKDSTNFAGGYSTNSLDMKIGAATWVSNQFTSGLVDELTIYNRALSASEITSIYNAGSLGKCVP